LKDNLTIKVVKFATIPKATEIDIYVNTVKNANPTASDSKTEAFVAYTLFDSTINNKIDYLKAAENKQLTLTAALQAGTASVTAIEFYPTNSAAPSDMTLKFNLQSSVPKGGKLDIIMPGEYVLPASFDKNNCILNLQYKSCTKVGNIIQLEPASRFPAGANFILTVPNVSTP
jgi:hypothetical protein